MCFLDETSLFAKRSVERYGHGAGAPLGAPFVQECRAPRLRRGLWYRRDKSW